MIQAAPKDKLLIYNVKEGWEPLCKFLEMNVPDKPFPHKNKNANLAEENSKNPLVVRIQREISLSLGLIGVGLSYVCFKIMKSFVTNK